MREPPDGLTERVWQMRAAARISSITREEAIEQAILCLRRNLRYLARRAQQGCQTRYDEALERDMEAIARLLVLLESSSVPHLIDGGLSS